MRRPTLQPTLWRTCRALANARRLRILQRVSRDGGGTVSQIAARCGLAVPKTSEGLRRLQSRGLLRAERVSRWVRYEAGADASVVHAAPILAAVQAAFLRREAPAGMLQELTAFTHPRRLLLLAALAEAPQTQAELARRCGLSRTAAARHLGKLARRRLVALAARGACTLAPHPPPLAADLLHVLRPPSA
jgi:DNA-binding IclR family transcriptional regulator